MKEEAGDKGRRRGEGESREGGEEVKEEVVEEWMRGRGVGGGGDCRGRQGQYEEGGGDGGHGGDKEEAGGVTRRRRRMRSGGR